MKKQPTKEECWAKFWEIVAHAHVEACEREAAGAAPGTAPREQIMQPLIPKE
ncbi:hypothetical protein [Micromonospora coxensis]|uniref:hypothetical protein n=1 Tax=Micromonospora coxensis TaxID=356852 RepID=UPI003445D4EE